MSNKEVKMELSDVLDEILLSDEELSSANISKWMKEYPQFEADIMEFAAFQAIDKHVSDPEELVATDREVSAQRLELVKGIVRSAVMENQESIESIASLAVQAKKKGLKFSQLARKVGLSLPLMANLEQRFVSFASIPEDIFNNLANVLEVSAESIRNYLQLPPEMTTQASFKAKDKPEKPGQEDFFKLVERDRGLTPEQKDNLLKLRE
jgi:transcriptional regulator with XRE-family HTH domain